MRLAVPKQWKRVSFKELKAGDVIREPIYIDDKPVDVRLNREYTVGPVTVTRHSHYPGDVYSFDGAPRQRGRSVHFMTLVFDDGSELCTIDRLVQLKPLKANGQHVPTSKGK